MPRFLLSRNLWFQVQRYFTLKSQLKKIIKLKLMTNILYLLFIAMSRLSAIVRSKSQTLVLQHGPWNLAGTAQFPGSASSFPQSWLLCWRAASKNSHDFKKGVISGPLIICPKTVSESPRFLLRCLSVHRRLVWKEGRKLTLRHGIFHQSATFIIHQTNVCCTPPCTRTVINAGGAGGDRQGLYYFGWGLGIAGGGCRWIKIINKTILVMIL